MMFRSTISCLTVCCSTLFSLTPSAVLGQQFPDTVHLSPVVVTATRVAVPQAVVPAAVTVISGASLAARGIRTVAEALRTVPGVTVVETGSYGGQTSVFVRGGESDYLKVLVDGVPQNQPGGFFDFANLPVDQVDRIEVVRGPASVLYGSDAVTGVIQIFTRSGTGRPRARVSFGGGTYGTTWSSAELDGGAGIASYGLSASRFTSDGIYAFNNQDRRGAAAARVRLAPDSLTDATFTARYTDGDFHFPTDFTGQPTDSAQHTIARGPTFAFDGRRVLSPRLELRASAGFHGESDRYDDDPDSVHAHDVYHRATAGARVVYRGAGPVITAGLDAERESQTGSITARRDDGALYAEVLTGSPQTVATTVGARLEDNERFGRHLTVRGGVVVPLDSATRARAMIGTAFKEPSFFQNYASYATDFAIGNPNLKPEQATSAEVGLDHTVPGGRVTFTTTLFTQRFRDLIEYDPNDTVTSYHNVAHATASGVEFGVTARIVPALDATLDYTYVETRDTAGARLQRRPTHAADATLAWRPGARLDASAAALFTGDRDDYDYATFPATRVTLPPHSRVDVAAEYALRDALGRGPGVILRGRVENVFDAGYQEVARFPARGRTIFVGGTLEF